MSNKVYVFKQVIHVTRFIEAPNEETAYEIAEGTDPLTGDLDYEEPELDYVEDMEGNLLWDAKLGDTV